MGRAFRRNGSTFTLFCIERHRGYASGQIDITELVFVSLLLYLSYLQLNVNWCGDATVNRGGRFSWRSLNGISDLLSDLMRRSR
jgi:hypothetical protein